MDRCVVVVVTFNHEAHIRPCLQALAGERVVVIDNASSDGTASVVAAEFPDVELVRSSSNLGFARAANLGMGLHPEYDVLVLNPDAVVDAGAVEELAAALARHPRAGLVAPILRNPDQSVQDSVRTFKTITTLVARRTPFGRTRWGRVILERHLRGAEPGSEEDPLIDWALGAALYARRAAIEQVGPLDEQFFLYEEDADWCHRMWSAGWEVRLIPSAHAVHAYQRASRATWNLRSPTTRHHWASIARFTRKHPSTVLLGRSPRPEGPWG